MLESGAQVGRYVIRRKLTEGGMAEIYTARAVGPEGFSKDVVIKVIHGFLARDSQFVQMFIAEARLASKLNHANVVQIFDFGKHETSYYLAMEYVRGASLWDLRKRCRERAIPLPPTLAAEIGAQVARGLQYAHALSEGGQKLGVVHRDVTPHNVLLSFDGAVKLTDFGIAKATTSQTAPGMLKGKFAYMAPEQSRGEKVDARTDIFALGIVLWELLTGARLFSGDSDLAVLRAVQESFIAPPSRLNPEVPQDLSDIVMKALARVPEERFQTSFEFEKALANWVLRTAKSIEDTSVSLFLQQVFREELETPSLEHPLPEGDDLGDADTHARPVTGGHKTLTATPQPVPVPLHESRAAKTLTTFRPTAPPAAEDASQRPTEELAPMAGGSPSSKPQTEQMPALRRSVRKLEPLPVPTAAEAPSVIVSESSGHASTERVSALELPSQAPTAEHVPPHASRSNVPLYGGLALLVSIAAVGSYALTSREAAPAPVVAPEAPTPALAAATAPTAEPRPAPAEAAVPADGPKPAPVEAAPKPAPVEAPKPAAEGAPEALAAAPRREPEPAAKAPAPAARKQGVLAVKAVPFATVTVQGRVFEVVGVQKLPAPAGTYEITLVHPRRTTRERVTVTAGETTPVSFSAE